MIVSRLLPHRPTCELATAERSPPSERQARYDKLSKRLSQDPNYDGLRDFNQTGPMIAFSLRELEFQKQDKKIRGVK